nr:acyl-CoA dehydrogenase family protein [Brevibacterium sp. RIT 803]
MHNGEKSWISNAGESSFYTVMAVTGPRGQSGRDITAFAAEHGYPELSLGAKERKLGIKGSPTRELIFDDCRISADRIVGQKGHGLEVALHTHGHARITIATQAVGVAHGTSDYAIGLVKERSNLVIESPSSKGSISCSQT